MATVTSPDNIPIPTSGDMVSPLETIFAAQATALQTALTALRTQLGVQGNYYRGTNAQMTAQLSTVPRGAYWFNTTNNTTYRRGASAWIVWDQPDWTAVTMVPANASSSTTATPVSVTIRGGRVYYRGVMTVGTGNTIPSFVNVFTVNAPYTPGNSGDVTSSAIIYTAAYNATGVTNGTIGIRFFGAGTAQLVAAMPQANTQVFLAGISYQVDGDL